MPDTVTARYLGDTPIAMPHLVEVDRNAQDFKTWVQGGAEGLNPRCLVIKGDEIPMDKQSAEGRDDFEVVTKTSAKKES